MFHERGATGPRICMARAQQATAPPSARSARAIDQGKRADEPPARTHRLLHDQRGRVCALASKSAIELAAWMHVFTNPVPGTKRPRADPAPAPDGRGSVVRSRHAAPTPLRLITNQLAIQPRPSEQGQPRLQITFAPLQDGLVERLQGVILQALGPLLQRRPAMIVAQAVGASPVVPTPLRPLLMHGAPAPGNSIIPAPVPLRAQLTAAGLRDAAQQAALQHPRLTTQLVAQRAATGVPTTLAAIEAAQVVRESMQLVVLLPPYALAAVCGTSVARLFDSTPRQIVDHVLRRTRRRWTATTIAGARRAFVRLLLWLEAHDIEHDGTVDGLTLGAYLDDVDRSARARCAARAAHLRDTGVEAPRGKPQTGEHAAQGQWAHLDYLRRQWGLQLATAAAKTRYEPARRPPQPAPPPSIRAVFTLEALLVRHRGTLAAPVLNVAAATLFLAYACSRVEQAQACYFDGWQDGFLHGVFLLDKHPNPDKRRPRRFWVPTKGLLGTGEWMDVLVTSLRGNEGACAVFLENDSPDGDPFKATRTFNAAMAKDRVAIAKRVIWRRIMGASLADENTLHSERHFLPHVAQARGEPPEEAVELGRWSGSTAQDADLEPALRAQRCHRLRVGSLPDRYAQAAKVARVLCIITRQMDAIRATLSLWWDALPWAHGWHLVTEPPAAPIAPA